MLVKNQSRLLALLSFAALLFCARQGQAQNGAVCDSVFFSNFRFDTVPGQLALEAYDESSAAFDYPGFIFFDSNMDTLAMENVNFFLMGSSPQTHLLAIKNPILLPQSGFLSLYSGFYDTLYCTWPITLQDTGQNDPPCDSLYVTNLRFDSVPGKLALEAENQSSFLFGYPGFILFDPNMDTLAQETVNYFGIGTFPQTHLLEIQSAINLPQSGFLSLYSLFYDSLHCTWPITLADTLLALDPESYGEIGLYPVPASDQVKMVMSGYTGTQISAVVYNLRGRKVADLPLIGLDPQFSVAGWEPGLYLVEVRDGAERLCVKKLLVR